MEEEEALYFLGNEGHRADRSLLQVAKQCFPILDISKATIDEF
jgi:hypothetical protein